MNLSAKVIGLSAAPHITSLSPITFEAKYGDVIDPATIVRVDAGVGVTLSFAPITEAPRKKDADALNALCAWGATAFCHVSRLSDSRVEYVERSYNVGAVVNCRVVGAWRTACRRSFVVVTLHDGRPRDGITFHDMMRAGFSPMEALVNVSMQPSVLKAAVLSYAELSPGQQLTGTVCALPIAFLPQSRCKPICLFICAC